MLLSGVKKVIMSVICGSAMQCQASSSEQLKMVISLDESFTAPMKTLYTKLKQTNKQTN